MESITIKVSGMSCGGCVKSVTNVLTGLPGVSKATVTLEPPVAIVDFDPARVGPDAMKQAIADAGFEAQ